MKKKAIIISIKGVTLLKKERDLIIDHKPWGLILFKRNIKSLNQLKKLIKQIRKVTKDPKFPIMIDEEGGSVTRLNKIFKNKFSQKKFGDIYEVDPRLAVYLYSEYMLKVIKILKKIGININTVPVLDVIRPNTNKIIGTRSFSSNPLIVKTLGNICNDKYKNNNMGSVIKHIPGHGASTLDSHLKTPRVNLSLKELIKKDFFPFKSNNSLFAMTAHIVYSKIDNENVATFSKKIVSEIIRKKIGFNGIIISDDLSMKALKYDLITNAKKSFEAGCNIVLYCAGKYEETHKLIKEIPYIDKFTSKKTSEFYKFLR